MQVKKTSIEKNMGLIEKAEKNQTCIKMVRKAKQINLNRKKKKAIRGNYKFADRKKDSEKLCIILAGYKKFLWEDVFGRLEKYAPKDMDFCIVSSGLYSEDLAKIAKKNNWSYLSVKQNKVTLVQNIAINLHPKAQKIYKIDEDIFITKNFFTQLMETYDKMEKEGRYKIGFIAPLLPINGYAHVNVLEKTGLLDKFDKKFGKTYHDGDGQAPIIKNPDIAKFMWGETEEKLRDIDKLSEDLSKQDFSYSICSIRFSIGAILFSREIWEAMGRFNVGLGTNMGQDEAQFCKYCMIESKAIVVSENTLVGHFSYGPQTEAMKKYYEENREIFKVK